MKEWIIRNRLTILPIVATIDGAAWTALIYFGWHYFNCS
jgi:hypothetical protein